MEKCMINKILLQNYKCFENTEIVFRNPAILVGQNNAGKSTIIEALRLVSAAGKKSTKTIYNYPISSYELPTFDKGFKIDVNQLRINLQNSVYQYRAGFAIITAIFSDKSMIKVFINQDIAFATLYDKNGDNIWTKSKANDCIFSTIAILPQISPIRESESILTRETVISDMETYRSSLHFRNEIFLYKEVYFKEFKQLAEMTWEGLRVYEPEISERALYLLVHDMAFSAEIGTMGSGLQMWLQIVWFICKSEEATTIILDEPDIYMHPDMQIKILKLLTELGKQIIIATHSVEIISYADPKSLARVEKDARKINYANNNQFVQKIIDDIGGVSNVSLLRIGSSRKCLFIEGQDINILKLFADKLFPKTILFESMPCISLGGKSQFDEALGVAKLFYSETRGAIKCICVIDRDYDSQEQCNQLYERAIANHLNLKIWERKEIENYLLNIKVFFRLIPANKKPNYSDFERSIINIIDSYRDEVTDQIATSIRKEDNHIEPLNCNRKARTAVKSKWNTIESKICLVPGKEVLKRIRKFLKDDYSISCSSKQIMSETQIEEIPQEIISVIQSLINPS